MKLFIFITCLLVSAIGISQNNEYAGTYEVLYQNDSENVILKRTLTLNSDGTFYFHSYEYHEKTITPHEENYYGKGTWTSKDKSIYFHASESDLHDQHTLNFNTARGSYKSKHPRDKSDRVIIPSITIQEIDIFWLKRSKFLKK
ncbi:MAG: hypothetical protein HRT68_11620 [Flavobacteriaceae bacterium]|nr:hypothetical protein [Flavobacteriaceae bacterium]